MISNILSSRTSKNKVGIDASFNKTSIVLNKYPFFQYPEELTK